MPGETPILILRRLIESLGGSLSLPMAEAILQLKFSDHDQNRLSELASKSTAGTLTPGESDEYDAYIETADLLSLWKSKARSSMKQPSAA